MSIERGSNMSIENKDFRKSTITVYANDGKPIKIYSGGHYIYFGDKAGDLCFHFSDEAGKHHRIYGDPVIVVDEE